MSNDLVIVEAGLAHAAELALTLRPGELLELEAQGFASPSHALVEGLRDSEEACTVLYRGRVVAMFGVALKRVGGTRLGGRWNAMLWFLTGEGFQRAVWHALPLARQVLAALLERYQVLVTIIDARYDAAIRWARHLGFQLLEGMPYGPDDYLFHPAVLRRAT